MPYHAKMLMLLQKHGVRTVDEAQKAALNISVVENKATQVFMSSKLYWFIHSLTKFVLVTTTFFSMLFWLHSLPYKR